MAAPASVVSAVPPATATVGGAKTTSVPRWPRPDRLRCRADPTPSVPRERPASEAPALRAPLTPSVARTRAAAPGPAWPAPAVAMRSVRGASPAWGTPVSAARRTSIAAPRRSVVVARAFPATAAAAVIAKGGPADSIPANLALTRPSVVTGRCAVVACARPGRAARPTTARPARCVAPVPARRASATPSAPRDHGASRAPVFLTANVGRTSIVPMACARCASCDPSPSPRSGPHASRRLTAASPRCAAAMSASAESAAATRSAPRSASHVFRMPVSPVRSMHSVGQARCAAVAVVTRVVVVPANCAPRVRSATPTSVPPAPTRLTVAPGGCAAAARARTATAAPTPTVGSMSARATRAARATPTATVAPTPGAVTAPARPMLPAVTVTIAPRARSVRTMPAPVA